MIIKHLKLESNDLDGQVQFFKSTFDIDPLKTTEDEVTFLIGESKLTFVASDQNYLYHYCFLIPKNKVYEARSYMSKKLDLISIGDIDIHYTEGWHSDSIYFFDGNGNIAECIARYDMDNSVQDEFSSQHLLNVNEIGLAVNDVEKVNALLVDKLGSSFWKGDLHRFGTHGDMNGMFLMINPEEKKTWFPTSLAPMKSPFMVSVDVEGNDFDVEYDGNSIRVV